MFKKLIYSFLLIGIIYSCSDKSPSEPFNPPGSGGVEPLSDEEMIDYVQRETFKYFWNFAQTHSGAARERYIPNNPSQDQNVVATGGTGFGLMVILVGIERGYITRVEGFTRLQTILNFFENDESPSSG